MGLLNGLQGFAQRVNGLLYPGFGSAGVDPRAAQAAQSQAMMQMGASLLGGAPAGQAYGVGQAAGWEPIEQGRREAVMRAAAADRQAEAEYRKQQMERQQKLDQQAIVDRNRDRMYRRFDKQTDDERWQKDYNLRVQNAQRGSEYAPAFNSEILENGNIGAFDQRTGKIVDTGVKAAPKAGTPGAGMNERQLSGVNMQRDAAITYAANLTGMSRDAVAAVYAREGADGVARLAQEKGKRTLQGAPARIAQSIPGGKMLVEATNSDLMAPVKSGGAGIALQQNPTGPITTPDFQAGEAQMPQPMYPLNVQAEMLRQMLKRSEAAGSDTMADPLGLRR